MTEKRLTARDWEQIANVLAGRPHIVAAWVFDAAEAGVLRSGGDLDVALFFTETPAWETVAAIWDALQEALALEAVEVVVLNEASPILRFEAVSGRLVYCREREAMAGFVSLTAREYEDSMALARRGLAMRRRWLQEQEGQSTNE